MVLASLYALKYRFNACETIKHSFSIKHGFLNQSERVQHSIYILKLIMFYYCTALPSEQTHYMMTLVSSTVQSATCTVRLDFYVLDDVLYLYELLKPI